MAAVRLIMMLPSGDDANDYFSAHSAPPHHGNYRCYIIIISSVRYRLLGVIVACCHDCQIRRPASELRNSPQKKRNIHVGSEVALNHLSVSVFARSFSRECGSVRASIQRDTRAHTHTLTETSVGCVKMRLCM